MNVRKEISNETDIYNFTEFHPSIIWNHADNLNWRVGLWFSNFQPLYTYLFNYWHESNVKTFFWCLSFLKNGFDSKTTKFIKVISENSIFHLVTRGSNTTNILFGMELNYIWYFSRSEGEKIYKNQHLPVIIIRSRCYQGTQKPITTSTLSVKEYKREGVGPFIYPIPLSPQYTGEQYWRLW